MQFYFDLWRNYGDDYFHFLQEVKKTPVLFTFIAPNIHHFNRLFLTPVILEVFLLFMCSIKTKCGGCFSLLKPCW